MSDWQPIETAPKDGTRIIVFRPKHDRHIRKVGEDYYASFTGRMAWAHSRPDCQPTLWQPLPEPPEQGK